MMVENTHEPSHAHARGSGDLPAKNGDLNAGEQHGHGMHHRARRLFGRNGPRHSSHVPGDLLQTVEEALTMQYLNTQRQKELLAESADFVSYNGAKEPATLKSVSPWHTPKEMGLHSFDSNSGTSNMSNGSRPSWASRQEGDRSDFEGQTTSGSFSSSGSAGKQGSFKLNSRESSGTQTEVYGMSVTSEEPESSRHGGKTKHMKIHAQEPPIRRNSGKDSLSGVDSVYSSEKEGRKEKSGKIWSWKKFGLKKGSSSKKAIQNPLEEPLDEPADDPFHERSPLEDAASLPMDYMPTASQEDEVLADLPSDLSLPSSKGGSFRKYAESEGHSRESLRSSSKVNSQPQERIVISKLAQARAARLPQSVQYPAPSKDKSGASSILQEIDRMRQDAEVAEKKLLAAERLAHKALNLEGGASGSFQSTSGLSRGSSRAAPGNVTPGSTRLESSGYRDALQEASRSLAALEVDKNRKGSSCATLRNYRQYTWEEIRSATNSFDRVLGEGGFGTVYHGVLNHTPVAVKIMKNTEEIDAAYEFKQEVEVLGELRHPHIMMLLGCCPEKYCLVYEYMASGSLEDRLRCLAGTPPLAWYTRLRVCAEVASALLNLHSRPDPIVHRDLKPANILLDKNFVAKLGDVGLAKIMPKNGLEGEYLQESKAVGTLAYLDPEFQRTGEFSPKSDVYAFGIVLLDVLTGRNPKVYELIEDAVEAGDAGQLAPFLDTSAGQWPLSVAMEVASLAVRCSEMKRKKRPDLESEVMPLLDKIHAYASSVEEEVTRGRGAHGAKPPSCLFCPITQEIMLNPMIASDGHTYEAMAIQGWLEGNDRSPITNQKLPNKDLLPNLAIKAMISEWKAMHEGPPFLH